MKKRVFALMLSAAMTLSLLSACGQTQTDVEPSEKESATTTESVVESQPTVAEEPEEVTEITWVLRGTQQEDFDKVLEAANELLEERYNLKLNLIPVEDSEIKQRVDLMVTSGEYFDLVYTNKQTFDTNVNREAFLALDDMLENTEIGKKMMEVYPDGLEAGAIRNGEIYALPNYQKIYTQSCALIKKDLAEKYNLDVNATYETLKDLEPFMQQVLEGEKDIWPIQFGGMIATATAELNMFDEFVTGIGVAFDDETMTVKSNLEYDAFVENMRTMNEFFKKGYIRADQATVTDDSADLMAGRYAIYVATHKPGAEIDHAAKYGGEYVMIDLGVPYTRYNDTMGTMTAINVNSKHPEKALEMLYVMWTDAEIYNMLLFGLEGEHYTKVAADRVEQVADAKYNMGGKFGWQLGNQFNAWKMAGQADDIWEVTEKLNASAEVSPMSGFVADTSNLQTEIALYNAAVAEYNLKYVYAEDFDAWLENAKKLAFEGSAQAIIDALQKQVDDWKVANGK